MFMYTNCLVLSETSPCSPVRGWGRGTYLTAGSMKKCITDDDDDDEKEEDEEEEKEEEEEHKNST